MKQTNVSFTAGTLMSNENKQRIGAINWVDLTVADAMVLREFYRAVVGWDTTAVAMGDYSDFCMAEPRTGALVAGICHARGLNAATPRVAHR